MWQVFFKKSGFVKNKGVYRTASRSKFPDENVLLLLESLSFMVVSSEILYSFATIILYK